jgi:hypothetical protein
MRRGKRERSRPLNQSWEEGGAHERERLLPSTPPLNVLQWVNAYWEGSRDETSQEGLRHRQYVPCYVLPWQLKVRQQRYWWRGSHGDHPLRYSGDETSHHEDKRCSAV